MILIKRRYCDKSVNGYNAVVKKNVATVTVKFSKGSLVKWWKVMLNTSENMGPTNSGVQLQGKMDPDACWVNKFYLNRMSAVKLWHKRYW